MGQNIAGVGAICSGVNIKFCKSGAKCRPVYGKYSFRLASYCHLRAFWRQTEPATKRIVCICTQSSTSSTTAAADKTAYPILFLKGRIIKTWAHFLYTLLGAIGIWMSPETISAMMPSVFGKYSDTQVIIDYCSGSMALSLLWIKIWL